MRQIIVTTLSSAVLLAMALSVNAEPSTQGGIPEKVRADILKRHPKAIDLQASRETHFKRHLLEVSYKEEGSDTPNLELFREDGVLFTNELLMDDLSEASSQVKETLEKNFPGYKLKKAELISNPNGIGEEFEVYITTGLDSWKVSITGTGDIIEKERIS